MNEAYSIASVTVAYNGAQVLPRQLEALRRQTRKLNEIVVVNNASSDGTTDLIATNYPEVRLMNQYSNVGVGGGFSVGLDYAARRKQHDWVWLLDQDSLPADDSLERLLDALPVLGESADGIAILAPVCAHGEERMNYFGSMWRHGLRKPSVEERNQNISFVDSVISSGSLVRREAVEEVGLPRSDFFMDFVDHEYCLRLRRHGYKIAVVAGSRLEHAIGDPVEATVFGRRKVWSGHVPWREYYMTRNEIFTIWKYYPDWRTKSTVGQRLLRHALAVLLFGTRKLACLSMMYRGFLDGRAGRLGVRSFDGEGF